MLVNTAPDVQASHLLQKWNLSDFTESVFKIEV